MPTISNEFFEDLDAAEGEASQPTGGVAVPVARAGSGAASISSGNDFFSDLDAAADADVKRMRTSFYNAKGKEPDSHAKVIDLSIKTGLGTDFVGRQYDAVKAKAETSQPDFGKIASKNPALAKYLQNRDNVAIARDDLDSLTRIEDKAKYIYRSNDEPGIARDTMTSAEIGAARLSQAYYLNRVGLDLMDPDEAAEKIFAEKEKMDALRATQSQAVKDYQDAMDNVDGSIYRAFDAVAGKLDGIKNDTIRTALQGYALPAAGAVASASPLKFAAEILNAGLHARGFFAQNVESLVASSPSLVAGGGAGAAGAAIGSLVAPGPGTLIGGRIGYALGGAAGEAPIEYAYSVLEDLEKRGYTTKEQIAQALKDPAIRSELSARGVRKAAGTTAVDTFFNLVLGSKLQAAGKANLGKTFGRRLAGNVKAAGQETAIQALGGGASEAVGQGARGGVGEIDPMEVLQEALGEFGFGAVESAGGLALVRQSLNADPLIAAEEHARRTAAAAQVMANVKNTAEMAQAIRDSKVTERVPEKMEEFLDRIDDVKGDTDTDTIYFQADEWEKFFVERGLSPSEAAKQITGNDRGYFEAKEAGGQIEIKIKDFALKAYDETVFNDLLATGRFDPDGMTYKEASQHFAQADAVFAQLAAETRGEISPQLAAEETAQIDEDIKTQLTGIGFTEQDAADQARVVSEGLKTAAVRTGRSPLALYNKYKLDIQREGINLKEDPEAINRLVAQAQVLKQDDAAATETPEFKAWFGDSKVVDESGKPLVVYHGTGVDIESFKRTTIGEFGPGIYFSSSADDASGYANRGDGPNVVPAYLSLKNPFVVQNDASEFWDAFPADSDAESVQKAIAAGYDGVVFNRPEMVVDSSNKLSPTGKMTTHFVAFSPEQIKSQFNRGTFDPNDPRILYQADQVAPPWYSQLQRTLDEKIQGKSATVEQVRAQLKTMKPEEVKWSGIEEFLAGKTKVDKAELMEYLRANELQVEEVVKGEPVSSRTDALERKMQDGTITPDENAEYMRLMGEPQHGGVSPTKFSQYQLPGGENYRELLLRMPAADESRRKEYDALLKERKQFKQGTPEFDAYAPRLEALLDNRQPGSEFKSSHFDEPNILAHIRFNDRTDSTGAKVLFIEEIQSDWHQAGRKKGYKDSERYKIDKENFEKYSDELTRKYNLNPRQNLAMYGTIKNMGEEEISKYETLQRAWLSHGEGAVPDAPFRKTWHEFALKRMIRYAAENGYDKIAWTTGEQQAERYDLSKQVESVIVTKANNGIYDISVYTKDDKRLTEIASDVDAENLSDYVGKDLADKISNEDMNIGDVQEYSGQDLKVGGEGMKGFYDQIVPKAAEKIARKFDKAAKVEDVAIVHAGSQYDLRPNYVGPELSVKQIFDVAESRAESERWGAQLTKQAQTVGLAVSDGLTFKQAMERFGSAELAQLYGGVIERKSPVISATVHSLEITPAIRDAALSQGFPLFQADRVVRGFFDPKANRIALLKNANASTFAHEAAHYIFNIMGELAAEDGAAADLVADWQTLRKWVGSEPGQALTTQQQEQLARGMEAYLFEGRAPSKDLESVFFRMREWLLKIYKSVVNLNVELTDEVREVFGRMLATDEAIAKSDAENQISQNMITAEVLGLKGKAAEDYNATVMEAYREAVNQVDAKLYRDFKRRPWRYLKSQEVEDLKAQIESALDQTPDYIAASVLKKGVLPDGTPVENGKAIKLNRASVEAAYGKEAADSLPKSMYGKNGVTAELAAEMFGFETGEALLEGLLNASKRSITVNSMIDAQLHKQYGDLLREAELPVEVLKSIHNDKRTEILRKQYEYLSKKAPGTPRDIIRGMARRPGKPSEELKKLAASMIARKQYSQIRPHVYNSQERFYAKQALNATLLKKFDVAAEAKGKELLNHELYKQAASMREDLDKRLNYMRRMATPAARARLGKAGHTYLEQVDSLLEKIDLRKSVTLKEQAKRQTLLAWVAEQEAEGNFPPIPQSVLAMANKRSYKVATAQEIIDISDSINVIETYSKLKNKLLANQKGRDFNEVKAELIASAGQYFNLDLEPHDTTPALGKKLKKGAAGFFGAHTKMEFLFTHLDGEKASGSFWRTFFKPIADAEKAESQMMNDASKALIDIWGKYSRKERAGWALNKIHIPEIAGVVGPGGRTLSPYLTKPEIFAVALNVGNAYNKQALLEGYGWNQSHLDAILKHMTEKDWQTVQSVWDLINRYWPEVAALERRLNGLAPKKVEAEPVVTPYGTLAGGYYPLKFDPQLSPKQAVLESFQQTKELYGGQWASAMTLHGHTKERTNSGRKPVLLDTRVITDHLAGVIHDLTHREVILDLNKLISDGEIAGTIEAAAGKSLYNQLQPWLRHIANDRRVEPPNSVEKFFSKARGGVTTINLGLKTMSALVQTLGYTLTVKEIGSKYSMLGLRDAYSNPAKVQEQWDFIASRSVAMKERLSNWDRDVRDLTYKLGIQGGKHGVMAAADIYTNEIKSSYFMMIGYMDLAVSMPTWLGAYRKAMDGGVENIAKGHELDAIDYADSVVRRTQSAGGAKDLAAIQRGPEAYKLFTMFYSQAALIANQFMSIQRDFKLTGDVRQLVVATALTWFLPAILEELIRGRGPDGDDEPEEWLKWAGKNALFYPAGFFVGARDLVNAAESQWETGRGDYEASPVFQALDTGAKALNILYKPLKGKEITKADWRAAYDTAGVMLAFPTRQTWMTGEYLYLWMTGDERPENPAIGVWRALMTGKPKDKKKGFKP